MHEYDIISVGSATEDVFVGSRDVHVISVRDIDAQTSYLAYEYGAKIPIDDVFIGTGGGATNTAAAFARLGLDNSIICKVGDDDAGRRVVGALEREGITTDRVVWSQEYTTGYSVILTCFTGDRTVLVHRGASTQIYEEDIDWEMLAHTQWIYLSSLAGESAVLFNRIAQFAADNDIKLALNPGSSQFEAGLEALQPALAAAHIIFVNKSEAYKLTGVEPERGTADEMEALRRLHKAGCDIVVMTAGSKGAEAYDGSAHYTVPIIEVDVASTLGAGDAFASGCVAGLFHGMGLRDALRAGTVLAASVVRVLGAKRGLLEWDELQSHLKSYSEGRAGDFWE
ncbi:MAG: carbohydrate kinase family protein [Armatimonadota bacterium]